MDIGQMRAKDALKVLEEAVRMQEEFKPAYGVLVVSTDGSSEVRDFARQVNAEFYYNAVKTGLLKLRSDIDVSKMVLVKSTPDGTWEEA